MSEDPDGIRVVDVPERERFELRDGEHLIGLASYVVVPAGAPDGEERIVFFHTEVAEAREGQGLAGRLAAAALDTAVATGRVVVPVCPYITAYLKRHPEHAGHVSAPTPADLRAVDEAARRAGATGD
ncbi:N-acetyltransferase [Terrabacter sp. NPDC000476]|uniref:GNAT family N-acetyltransferase n=1 Tax=Terrabacter sp. NPDC000476 TaxID=3154258 RepID=UPI0033169179